jgi:hypothetical protein
LAPVDENSKLHISKGTTFKVAAINIPQNLFFHMAFKKCVTDYEISEISIEHAARKGRPLIKTAA